MNTSVLRALIVLIMIFELQQVVARPRRVKRISDSHLADLETRIALNNKIKGVAITLPVGGGRLDVARIGRKRRSEPSKFNIQFTNPHEDASNPTDPIQLTYNDLVNIFTLGVKFGKLEINDEHNNDLDSRISN